MKNEDIKEKKDKGHIGIGCATGFIIIGVGIFLAMITSNIMVGVVAGIAVTIGGIVFLFKKRQTYSAIGLLIFFGIALLLVSACFGLLSYNPPS